MSAKKQGRPTGTKKLPNTPPTGIESMIVRALFPPGFPVGIGYHLYDMRTTRKRAEDLRKGRIVLPDVVIMEGMHPSGREVSRITALESTIEHREEIEREFETQCTIAALRGGVEFFETVARGVAALEAFPKGKLAVADAWYFLRLCGIEPTPGMVANHANNLTDELITASKARDYLRSMGMLGGK